MQQDKTVLIAPSFLIIESFHMININLIVHDFDESKNAHGIFFAATVADHTGTCICLLLTISLQPSIFKELIL